MLTGLPPPAKGGVPATNSQPQPALKGALATARRQPQPATSRPAKMRIVVKTGGEDVVITSATKARQVQRSLATTLGTGSGKRANSWSQAAFGANAGL